MKYTFEEVKEFVAEKRTVTLPVLQEHFGLTYKEGKELLDTLVKEGIVVYEEGLNYAALKPRRILRDYLEPDEDEDKGDKKFTPKEFIDKLELAIFKTRVEVARPSRRQECSVLNYAIKHGSVTVDKVRKIVPVGDHRAESILKWLEVHELLIKSESNEGEYNPTIDENQLAELLRDEAERTGEDGFSRSAPAFEAFSSITVNHPRGTGNLRDYLHALNYYRDKIGLRYKATKNGDILVRYGDLKYSTGKVVEFTIKVRGNTMYLTDSGDIYGKLLRKFDGNDDAVTCAVNGNLYIYMVYANPNDKVIETELDTADRILEKFFLLYWVCDWCLRIKRKGM